MSETRGLEKLTGGVLYEPEGDAGDGGQGASGPWTLPEKGDARRLVPSDFDHAASQLGIEVAAIRAVAEVEAGGSRGFDKHKRPKILFETHLFRKHTNHRYDKSHPRLTAPYNSKLQIESHSKDQWQIMREAFALDHQAAVKSASWGMFQVLGENHRAVGWKHVRRFVVDMFESEAQHLRAFVGFCRANHLIRHLKHRNWAAFAAVYNGPDYHKNAYDTKMAAAYKKYKAKR